MIQVPYMHFEPDEKEGYICKGIRYEALIHPSDVSKLPEEAQQKYFDPVEVNRRNNLLRNAAIYFLEFIEPSY